MSDTTGTSAQERRAAQNRKSQQAYRKREASRAARAEAWSDRDRGAYQDSQNTSKTAGDVALRHRPRKQQQSSSAQGPQQAFEFVFQHQSPSVPSSSSTDTEWFSSCMQNLQQQQQQYPSNDVVVSSNNNIPSALGCDELLEFSAATGFPEATLTSDGDLLQQYQQQGPNKDAFGQTALHLAASKGFPCVCQRLIRYGADLEAREDTGGRTPLHMAALFGFVDVVTILIAGGALVTAEDSMGMTPLSLAVNNGNETVVEVLLSKGADPNQRM